MEKDGYGRIEVKIKGVTPLLIFIFRKMLRVRGIDPAFFDPHFIDKQFTFAENMQNLRQIYHIKMSEREIEAEIKAGYNRYKQELLRPSCALANQGAIL